MDSADLPRLAYLVLLGLAVAGWFIAENRASLGRTMRMALAWGLIFLGVVAGVGLWSDVRTDVMPRQSVMADGARIEVPRAFDGHYYLTLRLDGTPVDFVVDTGATDIVLSREDARRIGIDPDGLAYTGIAMTANGQVRTARARVGEIAIGAIADRDVAVSVTDGEMPGSLLGMAYLQRFARIEIADGRLLLER
ncbi:retropepsin-like aspartic protease family protein [Palleronia sp. KMU-117]|uniref:retropepsin-like aspartic protease family protein n=1 Tax=Palleronia sp. KMU-117 TaxID=3434108 RepID=UPI003D71C056